jgi:L-alanine-DL-glutamate epimerase-like enolase superfamily enzyme
VCGALSNGFLVEYMDWAPKDLFEELPTCKDGEFRIPAKPGHGIAITKEALKKYRT